MPCTKTKLRPKFELHPFSKRFVLVGGLLLIEPEAALLLVGVAFTLIPLVATLPRSLVPSRAAQSPEG